MSQVKQSTPSTDTLSWLRAIVEAGEVTEVFVKGLRREGLHTRTDLAGYYDRSHLPALISDAMECVGRAVAGSTPSIRPSWPAPPTGWSRHVTSSRDQRRHHPPAAPDGGR